MVRTSPSAQADGRVRRPGVALGRLFADSDKKLGSGGQQRGLELAGDVQEVGRLRACVHACVRASVRACVRVSVRV